MPYDLDMRETGNRTYFGLSAGFADARAAANPAERPKYVLFPVSRISRSYGILERACRWGSICWPEYPDGSRILRSPNGQKKPIELRHPKRRPRTCRGSK